MAKGKKTGGGSRRGIPNKRSMDVQEIFKRYKCNPLVQMIRIVNDPAVDDVVLKASLLKELAQYLYPKRRSVEHSGPGGGAIAVEVESFEYQTAITPITGGPASDC